MKKALITGVTGQDGSYLSELLIEKGYEVHGLLRRSSVDNTCRIDHLTRQNNLHLHYADLTDSFSILRVIDEIKPDEIYNLGAQSHVGISFNQAEYTAQTDALGPLRILEAVRSLNLINKTKVYQASTSELYGLVQETPQKESTPFHPRSPYGVAKLYAYWITINYREAYGMFACNGILFNHESPRRGENFVTRKITRTLTRMETGIEKCLHIGNLNSLRDWGHAKDYVDMQWRMLQQKEADDYVISSGKMTSVRKFIELSAEKLNWGKILWEETGINEIGRREDNGEIIVRVNPKFYRPAEVENLLGDSNKARRKLGWEPKISLEELISEMIENDLKLAQNELRNSKI